MAITIVATAGAANANSFATEAEYIAYTATLAVVPTGCTVSGSTCSEQEKKCLVMAFRTFNVMSWLARRTTATQSGAWPQAYAENPDAPGLFGTASWTDLYFADDAVPDRVKFGQIELALAILGGGTTNIFASEPTAGVIEETIGPITTRWSAYARATGLAKYPQVTAYIGPMLASTAGALDIARC